MTDRFRLTLAQSNPAVGDIAGNAALASRVWQQGRDAGADMVALPEMCITGYNAQDLVVKPAFHHAAMAAVTQLAAPLARSPRTCSCVKGVRPASGRSSDSSSATTARCITNCGKL